MDWKSQPTGQAPVPGSQGFGMPDLVDGAVAPHHRAIAVPRNRGGGEVTSDHIPLSGAANEYEN
jgi:hypothetical protein